MSKTTKRKASKIQQLFRPYATFGFFVYFDDKDELQVKQEPIRFFNDCDQYSRLEAKWRIIVTLTFETYGSKKNTAREKKVAFENSEPMEIGDIGPTAINSYLHEAMDGESFDRLTGHVRCLFLGI